MKKSVMRYYFHLTDGKKEVIKNPNGIELPMINKNVSIVGPITLAGSVSPTGQSRINFSIGRLF